MSKRHQPIAWDKYMDIHQTAMDWFHNKKIVLDDSLVWDESDYPVVRLTGQIELNGGLVLEVEKSLLVTKNKKTKIEMIQAQDYCYNLRLKDKKRSAVFRYDNWHIHTGKKHQGPFHKHTYDADGNEISVKELKLQDWPELGKVIEEAHEYYLDHLLDSETSSRKRSRKPGRK